MGDLTLVAHLLVTSDALPPALQAQAHNEPGFTRAAGWVVAVDATDAPQYLVGHVRIFATQPQPADFANA